MVLKKRIVLVLLIFTALVLVGRIDAVHFGIFVAGIFLNFVPTSILLVLSIAVMGAVYWIFRDGKVLRIAFPALVALQTVILVFWLEGWTAASAFVKHSRGLGRSVIDPQLEHAFMIGFWLSAALVFTLLVDHLIDIFLKNRETTGRHFYKKKISILLLEVLLLMGLHSNRVSFMRNGRNVNVVSSVSQDGMKSIQLVPMNAWIDTNGLVIVREGRSPIWSTAGEIGDSLTMADSGRFVWSTDDQTVFLLLNLHGEIDVPMLGYSFRTSMEVNPSDYGKGNAVK
jgi:hypothetical protein